MMFRLIQGKPRKFRDLKLFMINNFFLISKSGYCKQTSQQLKPKYFHKVELDRVASLVADQILLESKTEKVNDIEHIYIC